MWRDGRTVVADLCIPWERSSQALVDAENAKRVKYSPYEQDVRRYLTQNDTFPGQPLDIEFHGVAVGARGGVRPSTKRLLGTMGIRHGAIMVVQDMAIRSSVGMLNYLARS